MLTLQGRRDSVVDGLTSDAEWEKLCVPKKVGKGNESGVTAAWEGRGLGLLVYMEKVKVASGSRKGQEWLFPEASQ